MEEKNLSEEIEEKEEEKKDHSKLIGIIINILLVICFGVFGFAGYKIFDFEIDKRIANKEHGRIYDIISYEKGNDWVFTKEDWYKLKNENPDFQMYIHFDSGIISESVVQWTDNDYYLRRSFYGAYSDLGTPFLDYRCSIFDTNMTIYGHYVYYDESLMFTPLQLLTNSDLFDQHKYFKIYLETEIRQYEAVYVYYYNTDDYSSYDYVVGNFYDQATFDKYMEYPIMHNVLFTGDRISYGEKMVTLQTCVRNREDQRLIVVAREISRTPYPGDIVLDENGHSVQELENEVVEE